MRAGRALGIRPGQLRASADAGADGVTHVLAGLRRDLLQVACEVAELVGEDATLVPDLRRRRGAYVLPVKKDVRRAEGIGAEDDVDVTLRLAEV